MTLLPGVEIFGYKVYVDFPSDMPELNRQELAQTAVDAMKKREQEWCEIENADLLRELTGACAALHGYDANSHKEYIRWYLYGTFRYKGKEYILYSPASFSIDEIEHNRDSLKHLVVLRRRLAFENLEESVQSGEFINGRLSDLIKERSLE